MGPVGEGRRAVFSHRPELAIPDGALVADVGGGHNPHPRADVVIDLRARGDIDPYGHPESATSSLWVVHDVCSSRPIPFPDDHFDFVIATHVLEDIRDPIRACEEIMRIGRAGYIEVPSIESELTFQLESRHHTGRWHHRWLVELTPDEIVLRQKPAFVNGWWATRIPRRWWRGRDPGSDVCGLLWSEPVPAREEHYVYEGLRVWIEDRVRAVGAYPEWRYELWSLLRAGRRISARLRRR